MHCVIDLFEKKREFLDVVFESTLKGRKVFVCAECRLAYADRQTTSECEGFCEKFSACSLKITKKAIGSVDGSA